MCACAGLGRLGVVAGDGVKIAANASKEASRTEAGLRKLAAQVMADARKAAGRRRGGQEPVLPGTDLLLGADTVPGRRIRGRGPGGCWPAWTSWKASGRPPRPPPASRGRPTCRRWRPAPRTAGPRPRWRSPRGSCGWRRLIAAQQAAVADWQARRAAGAGSRLGRRPADPEQTAAARRARARLADLQAAAEAEAAADGKPDAARTPQRNVTDPDSRLMPVRGGGFIQGYNCQDAAADDRLMLGGYACQDTGDALQAQRLAAVAEKGAAVVAAAHAAHAADPAMLATMPRPAVHPARTGANTIPVTTPPPATTP